MTITVVGTGEFGGLQKVSVEKFRTTFTTEDSVTTRNMRVIFGESADLAGHESTADAFGRRLA